MVRASLSRDFQDAKPDPAANIGGLNTCRKSYLVVEVSVIKEPQRGAYIAAISKLGDLAQLPDPLVVEVEVRPLGDLTLLLAHPKPS